MAKTVARAVTWRPARLFAGSRFRARLGLPEPSPTNPRLILTLLLLSATIVSATVALAQDKGSVDPKPLPPLANPNDPARRQGVVRPQAAAGADGARVIGFYAKGCLAGAEALPINGATWQVMRLSRNRNWGHPDLVALVERLAAQGAARTPAGRASWSATCRSRAAARC